MKIGDMARLTGTRVETIRYYEKIGLLLPPARTAANYRCYDDEHRQRLAFVRRSRDLGFSLDQVRELLGLADNRDQSCDAVDLIARAYRDTVDRKIAELSALRKELHRMIVQCRHGVVADCLIIEVRPMPT
jgi:DNA-binding transcriptional MerR regulator